MNELDPEIYHQTLANLDYQLHQLPKASLFGSMFL